MSDRDLDSGATTLDPGAPASVWRNRTFLTVWLGQVVSVLGSAMTSFGLMVWVYQRSESVTDVSLVAFFVALPTVLVAPLAGAVVDRVDRRSVLVVCNFCGMISAGAIALLASTGELEVGHVFAIVAVLSVFSSVHWVAYSAAISLLVPARELARANGMVQVGQGIGQVASPLLAGVLVGKFGIVLVSLADLASFAVAAGSLLLVRIPAPRSERGAVTAPAAGWRELSFGFSYLRRRAGLLGLLVLFASSNLLQGFVLVLAPPLLLSISTPATAGAVISVAATGLLVGAIVMSGWRGPVHRVRWIVWLHGASGLCMLAVGLAVSPTVFGVFGFLFFVMVPVSMACSQAVWQSEVEPEVQGRVFAVRLMAAHASRPLAYLFAGPLADRIFEPLLASGGALAPTVGRVLGVGPGQGIGLLFALLGLLEVVVAAVIYGWRSVRRLDEPIPDLPLEARARVP